MEHKKTHKDGFKVPDSYFSNLESRILEDIKEENPKNINPFTVPEDYFTSLENKVIEAAEKTSKIIPIYKKKSFYFSMVAAATLTLLFIINIENKQSITFDDLALEDYNGYLDQEETEMSSYEMASYIAIDDLEIDDIIDSKVDSESILEYLDNNTESFEDLNTEDYE